MIVYNKNPVGSEPIVIITKWRKDTDGDASLPEVVYTILPEHGIDLTLLGLEPASPTAIIVGNE